MKPRLPLVAALALCSTIGMAQSQSRSQNSARDTAPTSSVSPSAQSSPDASTTSQQSSGGQEMDGRLQQEVKRQLSTNPALSGVYSDVKDGVVSLTGDVSTKRDRDSAKDLARAIPGIRAVKNKIKVHSGASSMTESPAKNAEQANNNAGSIAGNTEHASGTIAANNPATDQAAGSNSSASSRAAQSGSAQSGMAGTTGGMAGNSSSSRDLQSQIQNAIANNADMAGSNVSVDVNSSTIDLTGTVNSDDQRREAYRLAASYANGRTVRDRLTVSGQSGTQVNPGNPGMTPNTTGYPGQSPRSGIPPANPGPLGSPNTLPPNEPGGSPPVSTPPTVPPSSQTPPQ